MTGPWYTLAVVKPGEDTSMAFQVQDGYTLVEVGLGEPGYEVVLRRFYVPPGTNTVTVQRLTPGRWVYRFYSES